MIANGKIVNYKEDYEKYIALGRCIRIDCIGNIRTYLECFPDKKVELSGENYEDWVSSFGNLCISYDGGNHPEYASNVFSEVQSIVLTANGNILVKTEDGIMNQAYIPLEEFISVENYLEWLMNKCRLKTEIKVSDIVWDQDDDDNRELPDKATIVTYEKFEEQEEFCEYISNQLSEEFNCCHKGFSIDNISAQVINENDK